MTSGLGIDRLIDLFIDLFWWFVPFFVLNQYEEGVVLRFGRFSRRVKPGFHWIIPLGVEEAISVNVKPDGWATDAQSITLKCGTQVTFSLVFLWEVLDPVTLLLEVEDKDTVINEAMGITQQFLHQYTWTELIELRKWASESGKRHGVEARLTKHINDEMQNWTGVNFIHVTLKDLSNTSFRDGIWRMM